MGCSDWVTAIDTLLNQFSVLMPILLAGFLVRVIKSFFNI